MDIAFIIPPTFNPKVKPAERTAGCTRVVYPMPNIYELTVAAVAIDEGYNVTYKDFVYNSNTPEDLRKWIESTHFDVYCIWGVNLSIADDLQTLELLRQLRPNAWRIMMGPGPTYYADKFLTEEKTVVVRGEPEQTFSELMKAIDQNKPLEGIRGISYYDGWRLQRNLSREPMRDMDSLPFPARHLISGNSYHNPKLKLGPYTTAVTSRSCPYRCIYCVPSSLTFAKEIDFKDKNKRKPPIGFRSVESVEEEIRSLAQQGYKAIGFMDDNFIWNEERTLKLCDIFRRFGIIWGCQARVDAITEPIAKALGESGCNYVDIGVESFDDNILKYIKKGITSEQIFEAIRLLKKYNVPVKLNILIGCSPLETKETVRQTLKTAKKLDVDQVMFNIVSPFPGTEFHQMAVDNGWIEGGEYRPTDVQRESILNYPHLSARQMERALFRNNMSFFFSPRFVMKQLRKFHSWSEFKAAAKALKVKLFG